MTKRIEAAKLFVLGYKPALGWIMITIFMIFGARVWSLYDDGRALYLQVVLRSSLAGFTDVYYDLGEGLSESDSVKEPIGKSDDFRQYRFRLPNKKIYSLRFDPLRSGGHVEIQSILLADGLGNQRQEVPLTHVKPIHQIDKFLRVEEGLLVDIADGADDPQLMISFQKPIAVSDCLPTFYHRLVLEFASVALVIILLSLWAAWEDRKGIKRWICRGVVAAGLAILLFFSANICLDILGKSISPAAGGDTEVYHYQATKRWVSPEFYHGVRPWTVPFLYSLFYGARNDHNLILLQTVFSYSAWIFLALSASRLIKDDLIKAVAFLAIAFMPLNRFIQQTNVIILSESFSFSFLAVFLGVFFWYFRKNTTTSAIVLAFVALLFAFVRDTDAFRVLLMSLPVLLIFVGHRRGRSKGAMRHAALLASFVFIFIASDLSTSHIHNSTLKVPYTDIRWFMPMMNNIFQRVLPYEDRVTFFEAHGMPVTPEVRGMTCQWASSNNWQSALDPKLAPLREWNYRQGRQTYMKYLITHPVYTFRSAYDYREEMLFPGGHRGLWYNGAQKTLNLKCLSPLFLNDERDIRMILIFFPAMMVLIGLDRIHKRRGKFNGQVQKIFLAAYISLMVLPLAILVFHGDLMDHARHQYTNIVQLNIGVALFYLLATDWWLAATRFRYSKGAK